MNPAAPRRGFRRLAWGAALAAAIAALGLAGLWLAQSSDAARVAARLAGERWYAVHFQGANIGHYRAWGARTWALHFEFHTALDFKLQGGGETRAEDRLVFHRAPPHRLLRAEHRLVAAGAPPRHVVVADELAEVVEGEDSRQVAVRADLTMRDYLAVQIWLDSGFATPAAERRARTFDFDQLAVTEALWRVANQQAGTVTLVAADGGRTRIVVREDLAPWRMELRGFVLQRVASESDARLWERNAPLFADNAPWAPVDVPLLRIDRLRRLVLRVDGMGPEAVWPPVVDGARRVTVLADAQRPAGAAELAGARAATVAFPADAPAIQALAEQAVAQASSASAKAEALVAFVHNFLRYEDVAGLGVLGAARERRGDCTEFANLYTTLARAAGLPARTQAGLVYRAAETADGGAFAPHAWNEVAVDGVWRSVDPTWGKNRVGVTHLPLPEHAFLAVALALPNLKFRVVEATFAKVDDAQGA